MKLKSAENKTPAADAPAITPEAGTTMTTAMMPFGVNLPEQYRALFNDRVELNPDGRRGLRIVAGDETEFPFEAMEHLMKYLDEMSETTPWAIGDALNASEALYGTRASQLMKVAELTGYAPGSVNQIMHTCANVAPAERDNDLSIWFHRKVSALKPSEQRKMLQQAKKVSKEWIPDLQALGFDVKPGEPLNLKQFEKIAKIKGKGPGATAADIMPKAPPKEFRFTFEDKREDETPDAYVKRRTEAFIEACKMFDDPAYAAQVASEHQANEVNAKRTKIRDSIKKALEGLEAPEHKQFLDMVDADTQLKDIKAAIALRKKAVNNLKAVQVAAEVLPETERGKFVDMLQTGNKVADIKKAITARKTELDKATNVTSAEDAAATGKKFVPATLPLAKPKDGGPGGKGKKKA